eukprot:scaffold1130_cov127-Isochrysis_galbana.AAC.15
MEDHSLERYNNSIPERLLSSHSLAPGLSRSQHRLTHLQVAPPAASTPHSRGPFILPQPSV